MQEQKNNDDLFQYQQPSAETAVAEDNSQTVTVTPSAVRAPLLFSDRAPIPTRNGEIEQEPGYSRKSIVTEQEKTFTPLTPEDIPPDSTLGNVLVLARKKSGYSMERVCEITRISQRYIIALEADDFESLPSGIFGPAYIRTISKCYRLQESIVQAMLTSYAEHKAKREEVSREFLKTLNTTGPINEAEERRVTYIFYGIAASVAVAIIIGLWALTSVLINVFSETDQAAASQQTSSVSQQEQTPVEFDQEKFKALIPAPIEEKHVLLPDARPRIRNH